MGSLYPLWIEKFVFLGLVASAIFAGISLESHLDGVPLVISWVCGLPLLVLVLTEGVGRFIQSQFSK